MNINLAKRKLNEKEFAKFKKKRAREWQGRPIEEEPEPEPAPNPVRNRLHSDAIRYLLPILTKYGSFESQVIYEFT